VHTVKDCEATHKIALEMLPVEYFHRIENVVEDGEGDRDLEDMMEDGELAVYHSLVKPGILSPSRRRRLGCTKLRRTSRKRWAPYQWAGAVRACGYWRT
jgi:hypothetical protein